MIRFYDLIFLLWKAIHSVLLSYGTSSNSLYFASLALNFVIFSLTLSALSGTGIRFVSSSVFIRCSITFIFSASLVFSAFTSSIRFFRLLTFLARKATAVHIAKVRVAPHLRLFFVRRILFTRLRAEMVISLARGLLSGSYPTSPLGFAGCSGGVAGATEPSRVPATQILLAAPRVCRDAPARPGPTPSIGDVSHSLRELVSVALVRMQPCRICVAWVGVTH